jgi:hypothetical protein
MLLLADNKLRTHYKRSGLAKLEVADIRQLPLKEKTVDTAICVRFLDLVPEETMVQAMTELSRVTRNNIILTIRLGPKYVAKSNTATHDDNKFIRLYHKLGWLMKEDIAIFNLGWHVICLERMLYSHGGNTTRTLDNPKLRGPKKPRSKRTSAESS